MQALDQPGYTKSEAQRGLGLQVVVALVFGLSSLVSFSFWRRRWPQVYAVRCFRKPDLPPLGDSFFGWIPRVLQISDREVLLCAGLDSYVYLTFFRAAITVLWKLSLVSLFLIAPLRWYYLGHFEENYQLNEGANNNGGHILVYVPSTYIFTMICLWTMRKYTFQVVNVRQAYLGHQNSITDRTLRVKGIPNYLRAETELKKYLTTLFGNEPASIMLCRKWDKLDKLFAERQKLLEKLERLWASYIGPDNEVFRMNLFTRDEISSISSALSDNTGPGGNLATLSSVNDESSNLLDHCRSGVQDDVEQNAPELRNLKSLTSKLFPNRPRPVGRTRFFGLAGPKCDLLDYYEKKLARIDTKIIAAREHAQNEPATNMAFVTMTSVAQCQLAAQALFKPCSKKMVSLALAPSPNDIIWRNIYLSPRQRAISSYIIFFVVLITSAFLTVPLTYLARFIDLDTISRLFPTFGDWLSKRKWTATFVTDVLPTYVFSSFNLVVPYFLAWLSNHQGLVSKSDVEISIVSKNFFYVFVNLFLVFTIESTIFSFSVDKLAKDFAQWLMRLSSFYTNLIVLQGIGITPFKLLQPGSIFQFPYLASRCKTARDHHDLFKPQKINFGLLLPTPMLLFIVTLTYSILKLKILLFGLIYFGASYFVFKYQLLYTTVHPQHSTAQLWSVILRRVYVGIGVFHLASIGVLIWRSKYTFALLILPLSALLLGFWYDFEKHTKPFLEFIAIEAIHQRNTNDCSNINIRQSTPDNCVHDEVIHRATNILSNDNILHLENINNGTVELLTDSQLPTRLWNNIGVHDQTLDEVREEGLEYVNRNLIDPLDGPWVAANAFEAVVANPEGFLRRRIPQADWI